MINYFYILFFFAFKILIFYYIYNCIFFSIIFIFFIFIFNHYYLYLYFIYRLFPFILIQYHHYFLCLFFIILISIFSLPHPILSSYLIILILYRPHPLLSLSFIILIFHEKNDHTSRGRNRTWDLFSGRFSEEPWRGTMPCSPSKIWGLGPSRKDISNDKFYIAKEWSNLIWSHSKIDQILDKIDSFKKPNAWIILLK